jgi:DNA processing protein
VIDATVAWIALGLVCAPEGARFRAIRERHGSPAPIFECGESGGDLIPSGLRDAARGRLFAAEREARRVRAIGGEVIGFGDGRYPGLLREIGDPPAWMSFLGDAGDSDSPAVAIVGSREASPSGERRAFEWAALLARRGVTIVSGFARGIDAAAHRGALAVGGRTVAVLGCGLDVEHPRAHRTLRARVLAAAGAIVSEFPLGTRPAPWTFPRRNRVISGLSRGVLVIQAAARSGTLITARCAGDQGREVWAVPGAPEDPRARGTNALLRQGARLVENPVEVLEDLLPWAQARKEEAEDRPQAIAELSDEEKNLLAVMEGGPVDIDTLASRARLPVTAIGTLLLALELRGCVRRIEGMRFERL